MKNRNLEISRIQYAIDTWDLESCKKLAEWLNRRIEARETGSKDINKSLEDIGLSKRAYKVLIMNGITTIHQLNVISFDWRRIESLKGAGKMIAREIREKLFEFQNTYIFNDQD